MSLSVSDLLIMLKAMGLTAWFTLVATLVAVVVAVPLALALRSKFKLLSATARVYVEFMRGAPLILLLFLLYYGGPAIGISLSAAQAAIWGLGLFGAGSFAEIFRSGLNAVAVGDSEAARMLGLNRRQCFFRVELPQALRIVLPASTGQGIIMIKESAMLSVITIAELTKAASELATITFSVQPFIVAAILYWGLVELTARMGLVAERYGKRSKSA